MKRKDDDLLANLKDKLPKLEDLLNTVYDEHNYDDGIYRLYHHSFKVFNLQGLTIEIVKELRSIRPEPTIQELKENDWSDLNKDFLQIYYEGTRRTFSLDDNARWLHATRPIVEAFLHAKYFLEMAVKNGKDLEKAPDMLPSGWAAFLYLYNMR